MTAQQVKTLMLFYRRRNLILYAASFAVGSRTPLSPFRHRVHAPELNKASLVDPEVRLYDAMMEVASGRLDKKYFAHALRGLPRG